MSMVIRPHFTEQKQVLSFINNLAFRSIVKVYLGYLLKARFIVDGCGEGLACYMWKAESTSGGP
jgi:hypothetical protein